MTNRYNNYFDISEQYAKKYDLKTNSHKPGWNDELDAFRHAYMQADLTNKYGSKTAKFLGDIHENIYDKVFTIQPHKEKNMDLWNNNIGRQVSKEVDKQTEIFKNITSPQIRRDITAENIYNKIKEKKLLTNPNDNRVFTEPTIFDNIKSKLKGVSTGQAASIDNSQPFTRQQIGAMTPDEFSRNEMQIMQQLKNGQIRDKKTDLTNLNNSRIFTREDIAGMTTDEYSNQESIIMNQLKSVGIPTNNELQNNSGAVYIPPYTKEDGTEVKGYYRKR